MNRAWNTQCTKDHRIKRCYGFTIENFTVFFYSLPLLFHKTYKSDERKTRDENERTNEQSKIKVNAIENKAQKTVLNIYIYPIQRNRTMRKNIKTRKTIQQ